MTILEFCRRYPDVELTPEQVWACAWLTYRGKRFLVDFGYANAIALVDADMPDGWRVH